MGNNGSALTANDIQVNKTYRGKNPRPAGRLGELNDRTVLWISPYRKTVQYDSSAVPDGRTYPKISMDTFLSWASHEVDAKGNPVAANAR